jgi:hypothetical protein
MAITYDQAGVTYDSTLYTYNGEPFSPSVFPVAGVYIAFTDGPYVASPAWTEVTTYVRGLSIHRGRSSDFDQFDTGTAQLVLDNRDRRFDPFYTSGPYYTKLTPRRQIRVVGQIGGSTYEVFRGYIAGWPVEWTDAGFDSTVTIQAFDALGLMANEIVPTDWPDYYTTPTAPLAYWKLNDTRATNTSLEQMKNYVWTFSGGTQAAVFREGQPASPTTIGGSTYFNDYIAAPPWGDTANIPSSITSNPPPSFTFAGFGWNPSGDTWIISAKWTRGIEVAISSTGVLTVVAAVGAGGALQTKFLGFNAGALRFNPGIPTHFVVVASTTVGPDWDTLTVYINGKQIAGTTSTSTGGSLFLYQTFMRFQVGTFQEVAIWTRALTATEAQNLGGAAVASLSETTSARMNRLIGTTDYPAALQGFTASPVATVSEIGTGTGVVPEMQLVADSEGGEIYVSKTGILTTTSRFDVFNATRSATSQATFTDSGVGLRYGTDLLIEYDADNLKNDVTVEFSGDGEVNAYSDAVIEAYGGAATTIETQLDSPTSAAQLATMELGVQGSLVPRISPIDVSVNTAAADWQTILGLELLDRVTFKRTPTVGNQFDRAALINAIDHQIEPGVWRTQLTLSMRYTSPLTLDDDVLGTLDFNYLG